VGYRIIELKHVFEMRLGRSEPASQHQVSARRIVTENESGEVAALTAQAQQIFVQAQRQIEFAAVRMIASLPIRNVQELWGSPQLLPQLSRSRIGIARFQPGIALDRKQDRTQGAAKFELFLLAFGVVREQLQLVQRVLKLSRCFGHCITGGRPMAGLAPAGDGFFNEPSFRIM
jgi:hypothetical protein